MEATLLRLFFDLGMLVVLWLVQLVIYPSFLVVAPEKRVAWHRSYTQRVSFIIMPLMVAQLGVVLYQSIASPSPIVFLSLCFVLLCWGLTFGISVPLHRRIEAGGDTEISRRLVRTNWPRTLLWTLIFLLGMLEYASTRP